MTVAPPSQLAFTEEGMQGTLEGDVPAPKLLSAAKARDLLPTNVLQGEERPSTDALCLPVHPVPADPKAVAGMTLPELRLALRARGLSPAGARATLVERLVLGLAEGAEPVMLPSTDNPSGLGSSSLSAAYARADGLILEAPVHRGAGPPDINNHMGDVLSDEAPPVALPVVPMSEGARAMATSHVNMSSEASGDGEGAEGTPVGRKVDPRRVADNQGCDIFGVPPPDTTPWSALKSADYKGNGIFEAGELPERLPGVTARALPGKRTELGSHIAFQGGYVQGDGEVAAPVLGLSVTKCDELSGGDVFAVAAQQLPSPAPMNALKAAELDSTVFAEAEDTLGALALGGQGGGGPTDTLRARDYGSTCFSDTHTGPQARKDLSPATAKHVEDLYSKASAEGCTMAFAEGAASPVAAPEEPTPPASRARRQSNGGGVSSVVFG
jgi:hypothetical protein